MRHIRYAVKTKNGYIVYKGGGHFMATTFDRADLYTREAQAKMVAQEYKGVVVRVLVEEERE